MNKTELMTKITRTFKRTGFKIKKYSPEILIVAGVVGTVTSAVMACKATTKVSEILDKAKEDIDAVKECREKSNTNDLPENEVYTEEDSKKDLTIIYAQTGVKFAKLYAPSVVLGALSLVSKKLISNTDFDIVSFVVRKIAEALAEKLEKEEIE